MASEIERLHAAEDVCWTLMVMMDLGMLPIQDEPTRDFLAKPMLKWAEIAVAHGLMGEG